MKPEDSDDAETKSRDGTIESSTSYSLRQVALFGAGPTQSPLSCLVCAHNRIAFCASLGVYIYSQQDYTLENVITCHDKAIRSVCWSEFEAAYLAITTSDNKIKIVNKDTGNCTEVYAVRSSVIDLRWHPIRRRSLVLVSKTQVAVLDLVEDFENPSCKRCVEKVNAILSPSSSPTCVDFKCENSTYKAVVPLEDKSVVFLNFYPLKQDKLRLEKDKEKLTIVSFDPLSSNYFIAMEANGNIGLWDFSTRRILFKFNKQSSGSIRNLVWTPTIPGGFLSFSERAGVIKVWNVSQSAPQDNIKFSGGGARGLVMLHKQPKAALVTNDNVTVIDIESKLALWSTEPGHTETIFDSHFHVKNPDSLLTAGYDQTIKEWNVCSQKCTNTWPLMEGVIYKFAMSNDGTMIAVALHTGLVKVVDYGTGKELTKITPPETHRGAYFVDFHPSLSRMLLIGYGSGVCNITSLDGVVKTKMQNGDLGKVTGIAIDPFDDGRIAVAAGKVLTLYRVSQDLDHSKTRTLTTLKGHDGKVFACTYNPLKRDLLASVSDDCTVRVWELEDVGRLSHTLRGHKNKTRSILWHPEIPWLLITSGWDTVIRLWDIRNGSCIYSASDHHSDVYGITLHPERPYVLASTSRDSTIRFWEFSRAFRGPAIGAVFGKKITGQVQDAMVPNSKLMLCGAKSASLENAIHDAESRNDNIAKAYAISNVFFLPAGHRELWSLAHACGISTKQDLPCDLVTPHMDTVKQDMRSRAVKKAALKDGMSSFGLGVAKKDDIMREAASLYVKVGDVRSFCDIMIELGEWDDALALAPAAGIDYWRNLMDKYAACLIEKTGHKHVHKIMPLLVASGHYDKLINFYIANEQYEDAFIMAKHSADRQEEENSRGDQKAVESTSTESGILSKKKLSLAPLGDTRSSYSISRQQAEALEQMESIRMQKSEKLITKGRVVEAAGCLLGVNDRVGAIHKLVRGNEIEMAMLLSMVLGMKATESLTQTFGDYVKEYGEPGIAMDLVKNVSARLTERAVVVLSCSSHLKDGEIDAFYKEHNLRSISSYLEEAATEKRTEEKVRQLLLGRDYVQGVKVALDWLHDKLSQSSCSIKEVKNVARLISCIGGSSLKNVLDFDSCVKVMAVTSYIGLLDAMERGYSAVVRPLASFALQMAQKCHAKEGGKNLVDVPLLKLQVERYMAHVEPAVAASVLPEIISDENASEEVTQAAKEFLKVLESQLYAVESPTTSNLDICTRLASVPSFGRANVQNISISGKYIRGSPIVLEDGKSLMSIDEAVAWRRVCAFSPLMSGTYLRVV